MPARSAAWPDWPICAIACRCWRWLSEKLLGLSAPALAAALAPRHILARAHDLGLFASRDEAIAGARRQGRGAVRRYVQRHISKARMRWPRRACCKNAGYARASGRQGRRRGIAAAAPILAAGMVDERQGKARELLIDACRWPSAGIAIVGLEPSCLLTLRDEALVDGPGRNSRERLQRRPCCSRNSSRAKPRPAGLQPALKPRRQADPGARPLPPEGLRRGAADAGGAAPDSRCQARADRDLLLRHGRQFRL